MKNFFCSFILFLGGLGTASANTPEYVEIRENIYPRMELTFSAGLAQQTGYLTTQASVGTYVLGMNFMMPGGLLTFDWQGFNVDHDTAEFPLNNNKKLTVSTFAFIPHVQVFSKEAWKAYLGLGFTQVALYQTDPEYAVSYGSFIFSGLLRYELSPKWSLHYKTQWYNVSQTLSGQKTSFEVLNLVVGAGYNFF